MVSSPDSLGAEYKQHLRSLNHRLPQVIEHLVEVNILSQAEATRVVSASNQFGRLCQQLVSKGHERKALIFSEIESFRRRNLEQTGADVVDRYLEETPVQQHRKHVLFGGTMAGKWSEGGKARIGGKRSATEHAWVVERKETGSETWSKAIGMEPFFVQLYTFIHQFLLSTGGSGKVSHDQSHDPSSSPLVPTWLQLDVTVDQVLPYFPSQLRKSVKRSGDSEKDEDDFETVSLSGLLSRFKSYVKKNEAVEKENKLLAGRAKLVQSTVERNTQLEDEVLELRKKCADAVPSTNDDHSVVHVERANTDDVREVLEYRVKELMEINEQWALEARERASEMKVLQLQLKDAQEESRSLRGKLKRANHEKTRADKSRTKPKLQGSELSGGTGLIELQKERDLVVRENSRLRAELEEERRLREKDQDELAELQDRVDNLKVQSQGKLPTLKELAALSGENRQLREEVERGRAQMKALMQKLQTQGSFSNGETNHVSAAHENCSANKSAVLVQPLHDDDDALAVLNGISVGNTAEANSVAPIFFDATPLAPQKTTPKNDTMHRSNGTCNGLSDTAHEKHMHCISQSTGPHATSEHRRRTPRSPPPPNQPMADIVSGMRLTAMDEKQCPKCGVVFLMLAEREFQSHVAACHHRS